MSYKALYRKYRPQSFAQVVGQASITKTLQNAIISGKISHAYLFCGPRGTGKTTVARIFAKALNCQNPNNGEPCLKCTNCQEISESISPDVVEIDAASNNGVDEIRDIREKVKFLPSGARYKIYIIDEVHMLSTGAFNALLKTLEEPPKHVIFILATTEPQKLPATIISRCQRYDFKPLGTYEMSMQLKYVCDCEEAAITDDAINAIAEAADGGMRDALSILDQVISYGNKDINIEDVNTITGTISFDKMNLLMNYIESKNINFALETINDFIYAGKEVNKIISAMLVYCRDVLLYISLGSKNTSKYIFEKEKFQELALKIPTNKVLYYIDVLCDTQNKIKASTTPSVYLEIAIIKMCNVTDSQMDLMKRVQDIETKLENSEYANSSSDSSVTNTTIDNEKLSMLDTKINQVVTEFNKLELHKLAQRLDDLSQVVANRLNREDGSSEDYTKEIEDLKFEVSTLKNNALVENNYDEKINSLEAEISEIKNNGNGDNKQLVYDIQMLKQDINIIKNNMNVNNANNEIDVLKQDVNNIKALVENKLDNSVNNNAINNENNDYTDQIALLKQEIENIKVGSKESNEAIDYHSAIDELTRKLNEIYSDYDALKNNNVINTGDDLSEIKEKLQVLENRMYKFISSSLSSAKEHSKPQKKPNGQIALFHEDILDMDDIAKDNKNEKIDFGELAKEESDVEESANIEDNNITNNVIDDGESETQSEENQAISNDIEEKVIENDSASIDLEDNKEINSTPVIEENEQDNLFAYNSNDNASDKEIDKKVLDIENKDSDTNNLFNFNNEPTYSKDANNTKKQEIKNEIIEQYYDEDKKESIINKTNSSVVIRDNAEIDRDMIGQDTIASVLKHEGSQSESKQVEQKPEIIVGKSEVPTDKFAKYNIKDIEKMLFDSRQIEAKNDRVRVFEIWKDLSRGIQPNLISLAETLKQGNVAVVGNRELLLTYPNVSLCNQVMRGKFKREALKILYAKLGDAYNYIALPYDIWQAKRQEYVRQYQIGVVKPTLTPLEIPGLNIIDDALEYVNEEEKVINKAIKFFGDDIVKVE